MVLNKRGTYAQAFLMGASGDQTNGRNTIVHQFLGQLPRGHAFVANSEVEAVGNRLIEVFVLDDVEVVTQENFLQLVSTVTIDLNLGTEIICSVAGGLQHSCHRILGRVAGA